MESISNDPVRKAVSSSWKTPHPITRAFAPPTEGATTGGFDSNVTGVQAGDLQQYDHIGSLAISNAKLNKDSHVKDVNVGSLPVNHSAARSAPSVSFQNAPVAASPATRRSTRSSAASVLSAVSAAHSSDSVGHYFEMTQAQVGDDYGDENQADLSLISSQSTQEETVVTVMSQDTAKLNASVSYANGDDDVDEPINPNDMSFSSDVSGRSSQGRYTFSVGSKQVVFRRVFGWSDLNAMESDVALIDTIKQSKVAALPELHGSGVKSISSQLSRDHIDVQL